MIIYRTATKNDIAAIAQLHARSWQQNYRGTYTDQYLDEEVEGERLAVWQKRLQQPTPDQYILLAMDHAQWGALLDNLHVIAERKGQGIGRELMRRTAAWVFQQKPNANYHLSVLASNTPAIAFYEKMGGERVETTLYPIPGNQQTEIHFYLWEDCQQLI